MACIYVPARDPEEWRPHLADPEKHWETGHSAKTLAFCWQEANGFPCSVLRTFENSALPGLDLVKFLLAIPEHKVDLPPKGGRASQCDLFVLAMTRRGLMTIAVEGKVEEPFGPLVSEWSAQATEGQKIRLRFLCDLLDLGITQVEGCRYQLLHRTASAVIEAHRFGAPQALMLVHSFSHARMWFDDYSRFLACFTRTEARWDAVQSAGRVNGIDLYLGWVCGEEIFLKI